MSSVAAAAAVAMATMTLSSIMMECGVLEFNTQLGARTTDM